MERAAEFLGYANTALFAGLSLLSLRVWLRERGTAAMWFMITFGTLAIVTVAGLFLPEDPTNTWQRAASKGLIAVLLLFPYALFRFTECFTPGRSLWSRLALVATAGLIVWTVILPELPAEGEERPDWFLPYIMALLILWTVLSVAAAYRLWDGGRGEPNLARQRMRYLSLGSIGLNAALIIAGSAPPDGSPLITIVTQALALIAALAFFLGFAPPPLLRYAWRRHEQEELNRAIVALMTATDTEEVAAALLPHVAAIFGGHSAALVGKHGELIGAHGTTPELEASLQGTSVTEVSPKGGYVRIEMPFGAMLVWSTPFTPFFGQGDFELLQSVGVLADLALERCRFLEVEREARDQLEKANRELADAQALARLGSWEWDVKADRVTWSEELYRLFGVTPEDWGASYEAYLQLIHPEDRDEVNARIDKAYRTGEYTELEHRVIQPGGNVRWLRARGQVIQDESGDVVRMLGTAQDVTESKVAEEYERELREAELRQKQALELNDNVVQGLAVAGMALELGETSKAKEAISRTLAAAQSIITGLLRSTTKDRDLQPGDLIRTQAAHLHDQKQD
ncbi:MAG: PAS domain-containing protein [Actinomycetota bacterium]